MLVGNPAAPTLQTCSILNMRSSWWSFRAGYIDDWVYRQQSLDIDEIATKVQLSTYAGLLTLNFIDRIDLYGLVGSSRMQIGKDIFTKRALGWGVGGKWILLKWPNFSIGSDFKYFETRQKPKYIVFEDLAYNIVSDLRLEYHEIQGALGICYHSCFLAPYINGTYLKATMKPNPATILVRLPFEDELGETTLSSISNEGPWGMAVGLSLIDQARMTLSFEWRLFNQNAIDWNFEIRF